MRGREPAGRKASATAAGVIAAPDPVEAAQQIWSVLTPDPEATCGARIDTIIRGLAARG